MHLCLVNSVRGLRVLKEFTYYNNGKQQRTDQEIMSLCIKQLKEWYDWLEQVRPYDCNNHITVYVDDAQSPDFVSTFNSMRFPNGVNNQQITFKGAIKFDIKERVDVTNWMLAYGQLRIDSRECRQLYSSLQQCNRVLPKNGIINDDTPFRRQHAYEHWINSGVEYSISDDFYLFRQAPALQYGWDDIEERYLKHKDDDLSYENY